MPVQLERKINQGWKASENNRFGQVLEINFVNPVDGKRMFSYAPTLKDEQFWKETFDKLRTFDSMHKDMINYLTAEVDNTIYFGKNSECRKLETAEVQKQ